MAPAPRTTGFSVDYPTGYSVNYLTGSSVDYPTGYFADYPMDYSADFLRTTLIINEMYFLRAVSVGYSAEWGSVF